MPPVANNDPRTPEKIAAARERYGKPFSIEYHVYRVAPQSYVLKHINQASEAARKSAPPNKVHAIRTKGKP